ncbi:MAG: transcriptional repressor [Clostridia bacterium]|jgi:Fe2+ or Zn2+ uptake regulation protein|nr:transcriptional repressor [Clostridia bacterium]
MNKRNTLQKEIVFEVFDEMKNHPSATMVYEAVHEKYPSISRATVFRLLAEAAKEGNVYRIKLTEADDRFDFTVRKHYHIVCRECGAVADVDTDFDGEALARQAKGYENFLVEDCHLEFAGVCERCQAKNKN